MKTNLVAVLALALVSFPALAGQEVNYDQEMGKFSTYVCESLGLESATECKAQAVTFIRQHPVPCSEAKFKAYRFGLAETLCAGRDSSRCGRAVFEAIVGVSVRDAASSAIKERLDPIEARFRTGLLAILDGHEKDFRSLLWEAKRAYLRSFEAALSSMENDIILRGAPSALLSCAPSEAIATAASKVFVEDAVRPAAKPEAAAVGGRAK